jgi:hypothetical protein
MKSVAAKSMWLSVNGLLYSVYEQPAHGCHRSDRPALYHADAKLPQVHDHRTRIVLPQPLSNKAV